MSKIETTYDQPQHLTTFKVVGKVRISDLYDCLDSYYAGGVTPLTLWDVTEADLSTITADEIHALAEYGRDLAEARKGGKTAFVFDSVHDFGLGRMLETYLEIAGLPLETLVCRCHDKARQWLGIDEHMIAESTIYKIGSCIQKTETGKLDHTRSINLIHELSVAVKLRKNQSILVDLSDVDLHFDMQDLMTFAQEFAKCMPGYEQKIALLIPNTDELIETARRFKSCMDVMGFRLRQFFSYESAIEWLTK